MTSARHDLTPHQPELWPQFVAALHGADLPAEDVAEPGQSFFAFRDAGGTPVGFGGYLLAGGDALLRSIVVLSSRRRRGLGSEILSQLLAGVGAAGARAAWLLTMDADGFFARRGFERKERAEAPPAIAAAPQFTSICPASAVLMCRGLQ